MKLERTKRRARKRAAAARTAVAWWWICEEEVMRQAPCQPNLLKFSNMCQRDYPAPSDIYLLPNPAVARLAPANAGAGIGRHACQPHFFRRTGTSFLPAGGSGAGLWQAARPRPAGQARSKTQLPKAAVAVREPTTNTDTICATRCCFVLCLQRRESFGEPRARRPHAVLLASGALEPKKYPQGEVVGADGAV